MTGETTRSNTVVVGFDSSSSAQEAVACAAGEAQRRHQTLALVHALTRPWIYPPLTIEHELSDPERRARVWQLLTKAEAELRRAHPELTVTSRVFDGHAAKVLSAASGEAALLVVGHRGMRGFTGLLAGSVAFQVTRHARCPVIVARGVHAAPTAPVVVGVDGSEGARHAVRFAFATAADRGAPLSLVYAWPADRPWPPDLIAHGYPPPSGPDPIEASLEDCPQRYRNVSLEIAVARNQSPAAALIAAATGAGLLVVGARGGGFTGLRLGSVGGALLDHAPCDLAVVAADREENRDRVVGQ